jgi:hypothetical protein
MTDQRMIRSVTITTVIVALLGISAATAQDGSYGKEQAARACIQTRLAELVKQDNRNVTADAALLACTNDLKVEMKEKKKSECDATDYISWIFANENSKLNGIPGGQYKPDKAFLSRCRKIAK